MKRQPILKPEQRYAPLLIMSQDEPTDSRPWRHCPQKYLRHLCEQYGFTLKQFFAIASVVAGHTVLESDYLKCDTDIDSEKRFLQTLLDFKLLLKKRDIITMRKVASNSYLRLHPGFRLWLDDGENGFQINGSRQRQTPS